MIGELRPDVLTLDVEMPGMSGMEFLEEIMRDRPMPVVMLSSITQEGTGVAQKAKDLGAFDCFPKPLRVSQDEFSETVAKLSEMVKAAMNSTPGEDEGAEPNAEGGAASAHAFVGLAADPSSAEALKEVLAGLPQKCAPTVVLYNADPLQGRELLAKFKAILACDLHEARDRAILEPSTVHMAFQGDSHIAIENGEVLTLKMVSRDPIEGVRPSADILFGTVARAQIPACCGILMRDDGDGVKGLNMVRQAGAPTFAQAASWQGASPNLIALRQVGAAEKELAPAEIVELLRQ